MKKKQIPKEISVAKIGFAGVIISAVILGFFEYISSQKKDDEPANNNTNANTNTVNVSVETPKMKTDSFILMPESKREIVPKVNQGEKRNPVVNQVTVDENNGQINVGTQDIGTQNNAVSQIDSTKKN